MLSVKQGSIKYHFFKSLVWLDQGLNPGLPDSNHYNKIGMFANGLGDQGSILDQVIPKTQKMVLDAALLSSTIR